MSIAVVGNVAGDSLPVETDTAYQKMVKTDSGLCNVCRKYQSHVCHDCTIIDRVKIWEQGQFVPYYI